MNEKEQGSTKNYYDDFSDWYERERHEGYHALIDDLESRILYPYARGADVLELGCGTGLIMQSISHSARKVIGVDLSAGMIAGAKLRGHTTAVASVEELPFSDESFDVVYSFKVLAHVSGIDSALKEAARVTRPGGHLLLEFYNPHSLRYLSKKLARPGNISDTRTEEDVYTRWDTASQVESLLPPEVELVEWKGVRVFTPAAFVHKIPLVKNLLATAERFASDSILARFAGFSIAICQKTHNPA